MIALNEADATKRRIYFVVRDLDNALVNDAATGAPAGTIKLSSNGAAAANGAGNFVAVDAGLHYYELSAGEVAIPGFAYVVFERATYQRQDAWDSVGAIFGLNETTAAKLRLPIFITTADYFGPATGTPGGVTLRKSTNGAAFAAAAGSINEVSGLTGVYYYQGVTADAATAGFINIDFTAAGDFGRALAYKEVGVSGGPSGIEPTVTILDPAPNTQIYPDTALSFEITSLGGFAMITPWIVLDPFRVPEAVHDSVEFVDLYAGSERIAITNGYRYTVRRKGGWTSTPRLLIWAVAFDGTVWIGP